MIVVSGAGGKTGQAVLGALAARGLRVRVFGRRKHPIVGVSDWCIGDMEDASAWRRALDGATKVYHICPNVHPNEVEIGRIALAAAQRCDVSHFVYHSVLHPQTKKMPHHWRKMQVEEHVFESGIPFTIVQPTAYMQNIRVNECVASGVYAVPYPVNTRIALVDLKDVAQAVARILTEDNHKGATYELVGTEPLSQVAVAEQLSLRFGRKIVAREIPLTEWQSQAHQNGVSDEAIAVLSQMFQYYAQWGLIGNANVLRWLLDREPAGLLEF